MSEAEREVNDMFYSYAKRWEEDARKYRKLKHFLLHLSGKLEHKQSLTQQEVASIKEQIKLQLNTL